MSEVPPALPVAISSLRATSPYAPSHQGNPRMPARGDGRLTTPAPMRPVFSSQLHRERISWRGRRSWYVLLASAWPVLVGFIALQALGLASSRLGALALPMLGTMLLLVLSFVVWWIPARAWCWAFEQYALTDARVVRSRGAFRCRREEIDLSYIVLVRVDQHSLVQTTLGIGDVRLRTAFGSLVLADVAHPQEVADRILAEAHRSAERPPTAAVAPHSTLCSTSHSALHPAAQVVFGARSRFSTMPAVPATHHSASIELANRGGPAAAGAPRAMMGTMGITTGDHAAPAHQIGESASHTRLDQPAPSRGRSTLSVLAADVPSVIGLSLLDATALAQAAGLRLAVVGERAVRSCEGGRVIEQVPYPGICVLAAPELRVMLTANATWGGQTGYGRF